MKDGSHRQRPAFLYLVNTMRFPNLAAEVKIVHRLWERLESWTVRDVGYERDVKKFARFVALRRSSLFFHWTPCTTGAVRLEASVTKVLPFLASMSFAWTPSILHHSLRL